MGNEQQIAAKTQRRPAGSTHGERIPTTFHNFSAANALEVNRLPTKRDKNRKIENAERSEPNLGKIPGRANPLPGDSANIRTRFCLIRVHACSFVAKLSFFGLPSAIAPGGCRVFLR
jgi:hypothetical protein